MSSLTIKDRVTQEIKNAMKSGEKARLAALRMMSASFKQIEVDERCELSDDRVIKILQKMKTQREDAAKQYEAAQRADLVEQELYEISVIAEFLPTPLSKEQLYDLVAEAIKATGAEKVSDIGRVMDYLSDKVADRASSKDVGAAIRELLK